MKNLEEKIAEMQKQLDELKKQVKPTFEVGKWYVSVSNNERKICITEYLGKEQAHGYGFDYCGDWFNNLKNTWYISDMQPATDKEVEEALIKEAIKRGFKEGATFRCLEKGVVRPYKQYDKDKWGTGKKLTLRYFSKENHLFCDDGLYNVGLSVCSNPSIFRDGKWAEIIKAEPIKINGFDVVKVNESYNIGCKHLYKVELQYIEMFMKRNDYTYVTFSSENNAHKVTLETINKILSL